MTKRQLENLLASWDEQITYELNKAETHAELNEQLAAVYALSKAVEETRRFVAEIARLTLTQEHSHA